MARRAGCRAGGPSKTLRLCQKHRLDAYRYRWRYESRATYSPVCTNVRPASGGTPRNHHPWVCVFESTTAEETVLCTCHSANTEGSAPQTDRTGRVACGSPPGREETDALCGQATLLARTRQTDRDEWVRESVLFIGTQFSIPYTSMYSPAEAATPRA